jgi:tetratricopeptide (TPR) repeat protein
MLAANRPTSTTVGRLTESLREAPPTVPALVAVALFIVWATSQAGYPVTHWAPGGLIVLALLGIALGVVGLRVTDVPVPVKIALGCLAAYTALSFLSILWAGVPGDAWEGANRTLLYLLVFALFALWPQHGGSAALLLGTWVLAMVALAAFVMLHIDSASSLSTLFGEGRLKYPAGYENASAATWVMVMWPALLLAAERRIPWGVRGLLAGGAVLLADLSLLSLSRGSLYATPVVLILIFVLLPGRLRTFAVLVPVAMGVGVAAPAVLRVGNHLKNGVVEPATMHSATTTTFAAALGVGLVVAVSAAIESRRTFSDAWVRRVRKGLAAVALAVLVAVLVGGWAAAGNPVARVRHGWDTFKSGSGYAANGSGNRLTSGLGSQRYDFYRVALDEFVAHPLVGIGADNFQQQYLEHGRSDETPHYPHSVELRTLVQTGLSGVLLALVGLGAALIAGRRAMRNRSDPLARAVAAAALGGFAYWAIHGSFDWFWEFAGLGAPAFAMLGLACALAPRARVAPARSRHGAQLTVETLSAAGVPLTSGEMSGRWPLTRLRRLGMGVAVVAAVLAALSLTAPWLSQLEIESAARVWTKAPQTAFARLNGAARLNPLSDEPYLVAGSIALRFGDLAYADHEFALALGRTPGDAYATLERGAIASAEGDRRVALALLERAARLNPRDQLTQQALQLAREGRRVNVEKLNRSILLNAQQLA